MEIIEVNAKSKPYPIYIENSFGELAEAFEKSSLSGRKVMIVTDSNVAKLYLENIKTALEKVCTVNSFIFPCGENSKTLETLCEIYNALKSTCFERNSVLVALGGGVAGDLAGFAAATYLRGIKFVQIPTTLLSQVDSSVGGKTGVNFENGKNLVGAFYQPEFVYINPQTLKTLPEEEILSGLGEIIKYGFIYDKDFLKYLEIHEKNIKNLDISTLSYIIKISCKIKANIVSLDEKEFGVREILNFGHTFAHAIETTSGFSINHGKCVALGIICALYLSNIKGFITKEEYEQGRNIFKIFGFPMKIDYDLQKIYEKMLLDKKIKNGKLTLILLKSIGSAFSSADISENEISDAIKEIL